MFSSVHKLIVLQFTNQNQFVLNTVPNKYDMLHGKSWMVKKLTGE